MRTLVVWSSTKIIVCIMVLSIRGIFAKERPNGMAHATSWCRSAAAGLARLHNHYAPFLASRRCLERQSRCSLPVPRTLRGSRCWAAIDLTSSPTMVPRMVSRAYSLQSISARWERMVDSLQRNHLTPGLLQERRWLS